MNIVLDDLKRLIGELHIEIMTLKKKNAYLEDMIQQLVKGRVTEKEKEVKLSPSPGD
jgi:hypothetical protein